MESVVRTYGFQNSSSRRAAYGKKKKRQLCAEIYRILLKTWEGAGTSSDPESATWLDRHFRSCYTTCCGEAHVPAGLRGAQEAPRRPVVDRAAPRVTPCTPSPSARPPHLHRKNQTLA